jgi:hypothetical protein
LIWLIKLIQSLINFTNFQFILSWPKFQFILHSFHHFFFFIFFNDIFFKIQKLSYDILDIKKSLLSIRQFAINNNNNNNNIIFEFYGNFYLVLSRLSFFSAQLKIDFISFISCSVYPTQLSCLFYFSSIT